jgi:hypothetical protein
MISKAQSCRADIEFDLEVVGNVYAFDTTTISLCLSVFWWATYKRSKCGINLHTLYDVRTQIPDFVIVSPASTNDIIGMDYINYQAGDYYIFDRGYNDFNRLYAINNHNAFFVFRARYGVKFRRIYSIKNENSTGVKADQIGVFTTGNYPKRYPKKIRKISYYDTEQNRDFIFLTNDFNSDANTITELYRKRWSIELFFKWIKQHLKIKSFWGTTENAVNIQVYCAVIAYCLVAIVANKLNTDRTIYEILQIVGKSLLDKTQINKLLEKYDFKNSNRIMYNSLFDEDC